MEDQETDGKNEISVKAFMYVNKESYLGQQDKIEIGKNRRGPEQE